MNTQFSRVKRPVLCALILVSLFGGLSATSNRWNLVGPEGGEINCLYWHPSLFNVCYAGTNNGLFRSDDHGYNWRSLGLQGIVTGIAINPIYTDIIYITVTCSGTWRSTDAGLTWNLILEPGYIGQFTGISIVSNNPAQIFVGSSDGLFHSTDGGETWVEPYAWRVTQFVIDPSDSSKIYVSDWYDIYRSTDGGGHWSVLPKPLPDRYATYGLVIQRGNPPVVLAFSDGVKSGLYSWKTGGLFKSMDEGLTWARHEVGLTHSRVTAVSNDPLNPANLFAGTAGGGICRSYDGGVNWMACNDGVDNTFIRCLSVNPHNASYVLAGTPRGVLVSEDGGGHWASVKQGIEASGITAISPCLSEPGKFIAGTSGGEVLSWDRAAGWRSTAPLQTGENISTLTVDPFNPDRLYAGTLDGIVWRSMDAGDRWEMASAMLPEGSLNQLFADPWSPGRVFAATDKGLYQSTDSGAHWSWLDTGTDTSAVTAITGDPWHPQVLYAGARWLFKSTDNGAQWDLCNLDSLRVSAIVVDPVVENRVYAICAVGFCLSTDGGSTWYYDFDKPDSRLETLVIDPVNPHILYTRGTRGRWRSTDRGVTWAYLRGPGVEGWEMNGLAVVVFKKRAVLLVASRRGIFSSQDGGETWAEVSGGLTTKVFRVLCVAETEPPTLYGGGLGCLCRWRLGDGGWQVLRNGFRTPAVTAVAVHPDDSSCSVVGTSTGGIMRTSDGGNNWDDVNTGLYKLTVRQLANDPHHHDAFYCLIDFTLYISQDSGKSWNSFNGKELSDDGLLLVHPIEPDWLIKSDNGWIRSSRNGGPWYSAPYSPYLPIYCLAADRRNPPGYYAGIFEQIIHYDYIGSYQILSNDLRDVAILALSCDPREQDILYAGTHHGVIRSLDGGQSWQPISNGMSNVEKIRIILPENTEPLRLLAANPIGGLYEITIGNGDLDLDGCVDSMDICLLGAFLAGNGNADPDSRADMDLTIDGTVSADDLSLLLNRIAGNLYF